MRKSKNMGVSRVCLLTTVSTIALTMGLCGAEPASAGDPPVWIELGWQTDHIYDSNNNFQLPLVPPAGVTGPLTQSLKLGHSSGDNAKISFRPEDMNWVFSASVTYGRSRGGKGSFNQTQIIPTTSYVVFHTTIPTYPFPYHRTTRNPVPQNANKASGKTIDSETHYIVDFQAGKDVGLGMFGKATLAAGVRFAHFNSALNVSKFDGKGDIHFSHFQYTNPTNAFFPSSTRIVPWYHSGYSEIWTELSGTPRSSHNFIGAGPAISWDVSSPLFGNRQQGGELSLNWGVNLAFLFGKQKNSVQHHTNGLERCAGRRCGAGAAYNNTSHIRSEKNLTVPNIGGMIGFSYGFQDIKVNLGYRADFFFNAIGTGTPDRGSTTRGFQGPFASISIGLGD